jgi:hypothetical protein
MGSFTAPLWMARAINTPPDNGLFSRWTVATGLLSADCAAPSAVVAVMPDASSKHVRSFDMAHVLLW